MELFLITLMLAAIASVPALIWHDVGRRERRDAALILPGAVVTAALMPVLVLHAQGALFQDALYLRFDRALGVDVPTVMAWTARHAALNAVLNVSYYWGLAPLLLAAVLVTALSGQRQRATQLLVANALAFVATLPLLAFAPAIGPWVGYHFAGTARQAAVEAGMRSFQVASICFPSFHVTWAVLAAWALWFIRPLRAPLAVLATLIIISTVTTGWHYAVDSFAGIIFAWSAIEAAGWLLRPLARSVRAIA